MSDFAGYARTNLFGIKDLDAFWASLDNLKVPVSPLLTDESRTGMLWSGDGRPFAEEDLKKIAALAPDHLTEPMFVVVAGAFRGQEPVMECTVVEPSGRVKRNTLSDLTKGQTPDFSDVPVAWSA